MASWFGGEFEGKPDGAPNVLLSMQRRTGGKQRPPPLAPPSVAAPFPTLSSAALHAVGIWVSRWRRGEDAWSTPVEVVKPRGGIPTW